jgi:uncharacterized phage protein (TIGR02220 family)
LHCTLQSRLANTIKDKEEEEVMVKEEEEEKSADDLISDRVVEFLNEKSGSFYRKGGSKNKTLIKARLAEGFTIADFQEVILHKVSTWGQDPKMKEYLRPETLFGPKFESYLNAAKAPPPKTGIEQKILANEKVKNLYNDPVNSSESAPG